MNNRCPLCGGLNSCAVIEGKPIDECWCKAVKIPQALLEKVPAELRGKVCVCQTCVIEFNQAGNK